ncbi:hypothetical protein N9Q05_02280 [bacterium]|nr:hypothetical protein [bacterium]
MPKGYNPAFLIGTLYALNKHKITVGAPISVANSARQLKFNNIKKTVSVLRAGEATKISKPIMNNANAKYFTEVYVSDTNRANGTGHISASMIRATENGSEIVKHMSYMPSPGVSSVGAMLCGFVPVGAANDEQKRDEDVQKANTIIRIPLTQDQFNQGVAAHEGIESGANKGSYLYAVTAGANIVALMLTKLVSASRGHEASLKHYIEDTGFAPPEDPNGFLVMSGYYHPEHHTGALVLNCTAAVQVIIEESGLEMDDSYVMPASLGQAVLKQCPGAEVVPSSLVMPAINDNVEKEDEFPDGGKAYD